MSITKEEPCSLIQVQRKSALDPVQIQKLMVNCCIKITTWCNEIITFLCSLFPLGSIETTDHLVSKELIHDLNTLYNNITTCLQPNFQNVQYMLQSAPFFTDFIDKSEVQRLWCEKDYLIRPLLLINCKLCTSFFLLFSFFCTLYI